MTNLIPIPHTGKKPDWLEDGAAVVSISPSGEYWNSACYHDWSSGAAFYLASEEHWAAAVLIYNAAHGTNFKPWNPHHHGNTKLMFKTAPDYSGEQLLMRDLRIREGKGVSVWWWGDPIAPRNDVIGYTASAHPEDVHPMEIVMSRDPIPVEEDGKPDASLEKQLCEARAIIDQFQDGDIDVSGTAMIYRDPRGLCERARAFLNGEQS